ncbi:MAG: hypothetical protein PWQ77_1568 [Kosmotogales bacterium]|nr:hypothetical protein [Kosmotogales bacterium]
MKQKIVFWFLWKTEKFLVYCKFCFIELRKNSVEKFISGCNSNMLKFFCDIKVFLG